MERRLVEPHMVALGVGAMTAVSLVLTLGFACALPLAAFATISALLFGAGGSVAAVLLVWLANQAAGFGFMHYPAAPTTFAWGGVLGLLGLVSLAAARASLSRVGGPFGAVAALLAAFVAYEGLLCVIDVGLGLDPSVFILPVVARVFAINAVTFGVLFTARALALRWRAPERGTAAHVLRV